jgi:hypothetical protein
VSAILTKHPVVDGVLDSFGDALGADAGRYRNHVYRGLNYQRKLLGLSAVPDAIALAWAVHDIGVWTTSWDYIAPSAAQVDVLAPRYGINDVARVRLMVELHHKVRPYRQDDWVETFRVADRIDVSLGLLPGMLTRVEIREVVEAFPYDGFHNLLVRTAAAWTAKHPLRPMPMMRW